MKVLLAIGALFCMGMACAADPIIYKPGTLCDKPSGFCVDAQGVSVGITAMELGSTAAQRLQHQIDEVGLKISTPAGSP